MSGNVREWVNDFSNANAYPAYPEGRVTDPLGPATGSGRGLRGGSWALFPLDARVALRTGGGPNSPSRFDGFRLVRTSP
jgi:formylglycine-generating enzyme required for sulfatase activity